MSPTREERDSLGPVEIPADALYGPQTARAVANFPISGWAMPSEFIRAAALIKQAAAAIHRKHKRLDAPLADAIVRAAQEVIDGGHPAQFPVDVFQTGSGTSTNMNVNEVIAHRANQLLADAGVDATVHPNDHVNQGQSSNDVIPTATHLSAAVAIHTQLVPALQSLRDTLSAKAKAFDDVVKIGRTHLMDAVPIRLGQEFSGYAAQIDDALNLLGRAVAQLCDVPIGGTAVGTGLNAPQGFTDEMCKVLSAKLELPIRPVSNRFAHQGARDTALLASAALRGLAIAMSKIASDLRLLASGPRCGLGELTLPAIQPGSSIMPGKVNPVLCESVIQVAAQVVGLDTAITLGCAGGIGSILELNVAQPLIASNLLTQIRLLTNVAKVFDEKCVRGIEPNEARCNQLVEQSLAMITVLAPKIGYDTAAAIAHEAYDSGQTIREICLQKQLLPEDELDALFDPKKQTGKKDNA